MKNFKNKGISIITLVITIVVMLILASVAIGGSTRLIDDSAESKKSADINDDNDEVRSLLTHAITDSSKREGISLDGSLVVIGSGEREYGTGYHLLPGGDDDVMKAISDKVGNPNLKKYKELTAPYVVDYDNGTFERLEEVRFK